jgi:hypothetical protein
VRLLSSSIAALAGLVCGVLVQAGSAVNAAEIKLLAEPADQSDHQPILIDGTIADGDLAKLKALIGERSVKLVLNSNGGSFAEAIKIARFLDDRRIPTEIREGQRCYSACAISFLGGSDHGAEGTTAIRRRMHPTARLGFHAPFLEMPNESYEKQYVEAAYELAIRNIADLIRLSRVVGIDAKLLPLLLEKGGKDFFEVDRVDRAGLLKVKIDVDAGLRRFSPRMLFNYCRNGYAWWANSLEAEFFAGFTESSDRPINKSLSYRDVLAGKEPNVSFQVRILPRTSNRPYASTHVALAIGHVLPEGVDETHFCAVVINSFSDSVEIHCTGIYRHETKNGLANTLRLMAENNENFEKGKPDTLCYPPDGDYALLPADTPITEVPKLLDLYKQRMAKGKGADGPVNK